MEFIGYHGNVKNAEFEHKVDISKFLQIVKEQVLKVPAP